MTHRSQMSCRDDVPTAALGRRPQNGASARRAPAMCLLALSLFAAPVHADEKNWAEKMFSSLEHDFGVVARGADVRHRVRIENLYRETVHISNVRTTCGCSAATPSDTTLDSREIVYVEVTMDTRRFSRRKDSNLIVTFDQPLHAEVRIPVTAYIRTDVVLSPGAANFGAVASGESVERSIKIEYAGRSDWAIREVKNDSRFLEVELNETGREGGRASYQLDVRLKPDAPVGTLREQLTLVTDDQNPYVPLPVIARVEADVTVTPATVSLGSLAAGSTRTFNVVLRGRKPFGIEHIECESADGAFKVRLPESERPVHVLPLSFTAPDRPGSFTEEFTVTIAGRDEPVTFKAYGQIVGQRE